MNGSEKQIQWAESIKSGWIYQLNLMAKEADDRV